MLVRRVPAAACRRVAIATGDVVIELRATDAERKPASGEDAVLASVRLHSADIPTTFDTPISIAVRRFGIRVTKGMVLAIAARRPPTAPRSSGSTTR